MANVAGVSLSFKRELMQGYHCLGTGGIRATDQVRGALYLQSGSINTATTAYTTSGEVSGSGYTAGGATIGNPNAPAGSSGTTFWTPSNYVLNGVTLTTAFDTLFLYNGSQGNRAICVITFAAQTVASGNFTVTMPSNAAGTALVTLT